MLYYWCKISHENFHFTKQKQTMNHNKISDWNNFISKSKPLSELEYEGENHQTHNHG